MANEVIKRIAEVVESGTPSPSHFLLYDDGSKMLKTEASNAADAIRPVASEGEALAGTDNEKTATPLRVAQYLESQIGVSVASKAQGDAANTALQPGDIGDTIQTGADQGSVAYRDADKWTYLGSGVSGQYLKTRGTGLDPVWDTPAGGGDVLKPLAVGAFASVPTIAALDASSYNVVNLTEPLRQGTWSKALYADYAADVAADVNNGYVIQSTDDPTYVWVRDVPDGRYQVDWFRTSGANKAANTAAVKAAIESVPSGSKLVFAPLAQYDLNEISATARGHIHIDLNGSLINNTTQVATGIGTALPILRVFVQTQDYDVTVENGILHGPRLSSSTTLPSGGYGGDPFNPGPGYASGLDIPIGRNIKITNVIASGVYYAGIEAHYAADILMEHCTVSNCGYSGLHFSDAVVARALNNNIDDIGAVAPGYGYGITFGTSYNDPTYSYGTKTVFATGNTVTRCKRKAIDVHDGLRSTITGNQIKGFGYAAIYAVGEGAGKNAGDSIITGNHIYGDPSFLSGATNNSIIFVGPTTGATTDASLNVQNNHISGVSAPVGIQINSPPTGAVTGYSVAVTGNTIDKSTFSAQAIRSDGITLLKSVLVSGNVINANVSSPHIYITYATDALVIGNICRGTTAAATVAQFGNVTNSQSLNNMLNGVLGA